MSGSAEGTVDLQPVQLIDPAGNPTTGPAAERYRIPPDDETLLRLYELMALTRDVDTELVNLQRQGEMALVAPCRGQEAAQVGAATALRDTDWLFPQYRELGVFLTRGFGVRELTPVFQGTWTGGHGFAERRCAPIAIPIATQALHAVGAAMAAQRLGEDSVTVAFLGDGATSQGDTHAALNMASVYRAGCVFYVQNNQWAISVPVHRQVGGPSIAHRAIGYGIPGIRVDGNDVLACHAVMAEAADRARRGDGPSLIEAVTYRLGPHTTSDDPTRYRDEAEVEQWAALDPLPRYRAYLQGRGLWTEQFRARLAAHSAALRAELREAVVGAPDAEVTDLFDSVYAAITPELARQRAELIEELAQEARP
ncbi:pyruvate dehydrogenase (acetyl-transferring) E1 component subunit alpha [Mycobacterium sp. 1274756.6]|uniref:pyruvate dehydrogenase (acetyl-transferring) E1 component subunit alpha n=1 Tax=Mycobacterium sp. 1274756.6 TaxID=1834076 RepID=UPI0007FE1C2C|nr:pyruvate dehydrogenase (acetyl-transferring) E1 component subunit alpha [Mycobacterium sp. 1274756.6]OBJ72306.1 pyruvate dehydrogenase (acetyl-transferring) E1 component subunit alpha [Mycobacterium sp. 1274756.6]